MKGRMTARRIYLGDECALQDLSRNIALDTVNMLDWIRRA